LYRYVEVAADLARGPRSDLTKLVLDVGAKHGNDVEDVLLDVLIRVGGLHNRTAKNDRGGGPDACAVKVGKLFDDAHEQSQKQNASVGTLSPRTLPSGVGNPDTPSPSSDVVPLRRAREVKDFTFKTKAFVGTGASLSPTLSPVPSPRSLTRNNSIHSNGGGAARAQERVEPVVIGRRKKWVVEKDEVTGEAAVRLNTPAGNPWVGLSLPGGVRMVTCSGYMDPYWLSFN
jgi:hypothetical protein